MGHCFCFFTSSVLSEADTLIGDFRLTQEIY